MDKNNYEKGFNLALENSQRLFKAAESLEVNSEFSAISNSLMVLAAEEGVKAYILFSRHSFPESATQDFNKYFEDHKHKLNTIRSIIGMNQITDIFIKEYTEPMINNIDKPYDELSKIKNDGIENVIKRLDIEAESNKTDMAIQNKWWMHAKTMKENGFYVSYNKGKWTSPILIKKNKYVKTKKYVQQFLEIVNNLGKIDFEDEGVKAMMNKFEANKKSKQNNSSPGNN